MPSEFSFHSMLRLDHWFVYTFECALFRQREKADFAVNVRATARTSKSPICARASRCPILSPLEG